MLSHRVNSIISGRNPPLYCTLTLITLKVGHQNEQKNTIRYTFRIQYSLYGQIVLDYYNEIVRILGRFLRCHFFPSEIAYFRSSIFPLEMPFFVVGAMGMSKACAQSTVNSF